MKQNKRHIIQAAATLLQNGNLGGFLSGSIFKGPSKHICVPGLNCYSCPGALGACPIGSVQAVIGSRGKNVSYYVVGIILLFGVLLGRLICGFLCPFGLVQDLLNKIPTHKATIPRPIDKKLRYLKFLSLAAVLLLPALLTDAYGIGAPYFCKYICPAGTLEGGIPLVWRNASLQAAAGWLFIWKVAVLLAVVVAAVVIYRPFCKYLCPLGALYGLLNKFSVYKMAVDESKCTHCGACERACKMQVPILQSINSVECIRCGLCKETCPTGAISSGFCGKILSAKEAEKR